jgi:hypothetical protein
MAPMEIGISQAFEIERMKREIDAQHDIEQLRTLTKDLLKAWFCEQASTQQAIRNQVNP